ncbi:MAG TPA: (d)CMP kinase [Hyphomicrobiales bacterium]|nr:(d)CMP kinase [Hyphomicrobiales bacterium]
MIIAIDGPAASGKGTLAKRIAAHYGFDHLDTGLLYRAVARNMLRADENLYDAEIAARYANELDPSTMDETELRGGGIGEAASVIAQIPQVREALFMFQRRFAAERDDAVVEGRDIGTVIFPKAEVKLYITAHRSERAKRRFRELVERGEQTTEEDVYADLEKRDQRDQTRASAPLRIAEDALLLDTTELDIDASYFAAVRLIDTAIGRSD